MMVKRELPMPIVLPQHVRITAESLLPEGIAQQGDPRPVRNVIVEREHAANHRAHTQSLVAISGHRKGADRLGCRLELDSGKRKRASSAPNLQPSSCTKTTPNIYQPSRPNRSNSKYRSGNFAGLNSRFSHICFVMPRASG